MSIMEKITSNKTGFKPYVGFACKTSREDLGVNQYNSSVVQELAKLNIEKASNIIDRKALNMFNDFVQSS